MTAKIVKIVIIDTCSDCPHYDEEDWDSGYICFKLARPIPFIGECNKGGSVLIPDGCPLPDGKLSEERVVNEGIAVEQGRRY